MAHTNTPATTPTTSAPSRRNFFNWLTYALGALATAILGAPLLGFFLGVRKKSTDLITLGDVEKDFLPDDPRDESTAQTKLVTFNNPNSPPWDGVAAKTSVYVRYEGLDEKEKDETKKYKFMVVTVNCAHLGCPVSWFPQSGLFMCPCHGGVYYANGERASGPPPRGLYEYPYKIEHGELWVNAGEMPLMSLPKA